MIALVVMVSFMMVSPRAGMARCRSFRSRSHGRGLAPIKHCPTEMAMKESYF
jgi:hypothetical protein